MPAPGARRSAVVAVTPATTNPWWWDHIHRDPGLCELDHVKVRFRGKKGKQITTADLPAFLLTMLGEVWRMRRTYDYVFTVECDFPGLAIALWQSLLGLRRPRHVIVQFIMRERTEALASRLKYALMTFMFRSVHRVICSSRSEAAYYREMFGWPDGKARFVPILINPDDLAVPTEPEEPFLLAGGRVFRDYATAIAAVHGTPFRLVVVGPRGFARDFSADPQVEVLEDIPEERFTELTRRCAAVLVPLTDRRISAGQTVLLQAMAMGKLVIATRTAGTEDYVTHGVNGLLVAPGNVDELHAAMMAAADPELRRRLGRQGHLDVEAQCLPHHYTAAIRETLTT